MLFVVVLCTAATSAPRARSARVGGTLRVNMSAGSIATLDPAESYDFYGGQLLYATCLRLLDYSDRKGARGKLVAEAAASFPRVSEDGRTYTFTVRRGFAFNTGEPVTAESFARAVERVLNKRSAAPAAQFYSDIVGADAVMAGRAVRPRGVTVSGRSISFRLVAPSPTFVARVAMAPMCAQPAGLPIAPHGVKMPPMAGPFFISAFDPGRTIVLDRNPNYHGSRPARLDRIVVTLSTSLDQSLLQVRAGQADYDLGGLPPAALASLAAKYGVNRGRFFVHPGLNLQFLSLNTAHGPLRDPRLRKAVNYALDRTALAKLAGYRGATPSDQMLVPGIPGYRNVKLYPSHPDVAKAKQLISGRKVTLRLYSSTGQPFGDQALAIKQELAAVGIDVTIVTLPFDQLLQALGNVSAPYDMVNAGWGPDFVDPYDYLDILLNGSRITARNNTQWSQFDDPTFNRRLDAAALLTGKARAEAYAKLDADIMRVAAPAAPLYYINNREFVSSRVGCYTYVPALQAMSLAAACLR